MYFLAIFLGVILGCTAGYISCLMRTGSRSLYGLHPFVCQEIFRRNCVWLVVWGLSFSWIMIFQQKEQQLWMLLLFSVSCFPAQIDSQTGMIPDICLALLWISGAVFALCSGNSAVLYGLSCAAALFFMTAVYFLFYGKMGSGDIFFAAGLSLWMNPEETAVFLFFSFFTGSLWGIFSCMKRRSSLRGSLPFAPFLAGNTWMSCLYGEKVWSWYGNVFF